jgi:hypothetical protein
MKKIPLSQKEVRRIFDYREDGELIWKVRNAHRVKVGDVAGHLNGMGYKVTSVEGKLYKSHRLIWLWHFGYFPEHGLDHIDRNPSNNRIENLREVSRVCNSRNCKVGKNNKSGITGVCWYRETGKWLVQIKIPNKNIYLGLYETKLEAAKARWDAEVKYEFPNCNTTSSAYQYLLRGGIFDGKDKSLTSF